MSTTQTWTSFFTNWPNEFPRRGVILTILNETIPFKNFWIKDDMIMIDRKNPDTSGSRLIMITFDRIDSVRLVDPVSDASIATAGFLAETAAATTAAY